MIQATRNSVCAIIPAFGFFSSWTETGNMIPQKFPSFWPKQQLPRHTSSSETGSGMLRILVDPTPVLYGIANFHRLMLPTSTLTKEL